MNRFLQHLETNETFKTLLCSTSQLLHILEQSCKRKRDPTDGIIELFTTKGHCPK